MDAAARKAQIEQERWLAQFDYQKQQDALAQQNWQTQWDYNLQSDRRDAAYNLASTLIGSGILPDSGTLSAAGISQTDAQALVNLYAAQMTAKASTGSGRSSGSSGGSSSSGKPKLTYAQTLTAIENGQITDSVKKAYDYYMGSGAYEQYYGQASGSDEGTANGSAGEIWKIDKSNIDAYFQQFGESVNRQMAAGAVDAARGNIDSMWDNLDGFQQQAIRDLLAHYGYKYEE